MNETSTLASVTGSGRRRRREGPGVRPLHRDHARISPEWLGELAAPDVDRVDASRPALEQDVGEPAGRRADVEAHAIRRVDPERVERRRELVPAPADVRLGRGDLERRLRDRPGRPASGRVAPRRRPRRGPCRRSAAPGHGSAIRRAPGRRSAGPAEPASSAHRSPAHGGTRRFARAHLPAGRFRRAAPDHRSDRPGGLGHRCGSRWAEAERFDRLPDLLLEPRHIEADEAPEVRDRAVVDEPVGRDAEDPDRRLAQRRRRSVGRPRSPRGRRCRTRRRRRSPRTSPRVACRAPGRGSAAGRAASRSAR